jgi:glycosyltransferase involved in cell wall biosynthesis
MNDRPEGYAYPHRVKFEMNENRRSDYLLAADFLNLGHVDVVCIQHEYGIFGGPDGELVLDLVRRLRMPVVVTLHTVLQNPSDGQRRILAEMAEIADCVIVMAELAVEFLRDIYHLPEEKIALIPHGIHDVPFVDPNYYKDLFGVEGKKVLLSFGLLSPGKGIDGMIDALPAIVAEHPDAVYIVLGATHPSVKLRHGEDYRHTLERRAAERGVGDHVVFHNKFVELPELMEFLGAADVYITPYLNETQIVSGTLAYALGSGKATVSTPYWYAKEMLSEGRGKLVPFHDPSALAAAVIGLLDDEVSRHAMRKRAYQHTRPMRWLEVAARYFDLFARVQDQRATNPRPIGRRDVLRHRTLDLPEIKLNHLEVLTDGTGILQHARFNVPRRDHGYCTDDNARALIVAVRAAEHAGNVSNVRVHALAGLYLSFLEHAWDENTSRFRNFMTFDRQWADGKGSEDCQGRALWALGVTEARGKVPGHASLAAELFQQALPVALKLKHPQAWAYSLLGMHEHLRRFSGDSHTKRIRDELAARLFNMWREEATEEWPWITDTLTYANGRLVQALLLCGRWTFTDAMIELSLEALRWLLNVQTSPKGHFEPVGCDGWFPRGGQKALFDQQPIEAAGMIDACVEAYLVTNDRSWLDRAHWCFDWFFGANDLRQPIYDQRTGGCNDALASQGVNENQGAESTLCWLMALLALYDQQVDGKLAGTVDGDGQVRTVKKPLVQETQPTATR